MTKPKIVILGGGVGGVTTAIGLSSGSWSEHYESITLYQQGWRLGGKGASGRRSGDLRIEEHGLHVWFGFYENAFRMLRECHEELDRLAAAPGSTQPRWKLAFTTMEQSFTAAGPITLADNDGCGWKPWVADFFRFDDDRPWSATDPRPPGQQPEDWSAVYFAARCVYLAADVVASLLGDPRATIVPGTGRPPPRAVTAGALRALLDDSGRLLSTGLGELLALVGGLLDSAARLGAAIAAESGLVEPALRALDFVTTQLRNRADPILRADDRIRRAWYLVDLMLAVTRGMLADGVLGANDFALINDVDFRDWLRSHGAERESADSALVRAVVYDLAFAYRGGDPLRPAAEAGTALRGLLRTFFTYRGALMWKMNASMGDVVFAPLYELLIKRGVKVEFFNRVERVHTEGGSVREIELDVQAKISPSVKPANFLSVGSSAIVPEELALWPSAPLVEHASGGRQPQAAAYESWLTGRGTPFQPGKLLKQGDDFTDVVFALPISMVKHVARTLIDQSPLWTCAVAKIETVPTQAVQLWLDKAASEISGYADGAIVGGFTEPYDTWADMNHLSGQEPMVGAATVAYFCNALADSTPPPRGSPGVAAWLAGQEMLVRAQVLRFLKRDIRHLWPGAVDKVTGEFDWNLLFVRSSAEGEARLDEQFLKTNVEPSERYVLSVPGSSAHRIHPSRTGFDNLYAAGDWTACGLDAGCVEAAVISGLLAANGIAQRAGATGQVRHIIGYNGP
jgi:uncharacterized protein with NAD-binding domain and iron-sulfur cluster